jgi:glycosyltransferase involved in cell wall biosynthesis
VTPTAVRLLYLADIRFPLERANGIQTMETCHALAVRGHRVVLRVRPDTHQPPRDPFVFYGVPHVEGLTIEVAQAPARPAALRRAIYVAGSWVRAMTDSWDVILTRDLALAAAMLRVPRAERPPVVYESHGFAPEVSADLASMLSDGRDSSPRKQARLLARERRVWDRADGYVTITRALAVELVERFGVRPRLAVVPDGVRVRPVTRPPRAFPATPTVGYAGHLYPWKGVHVLLEAVSRLPHVRGLIIGGHDRERDLERCREHARELGIEDRVCFTGFVPPDQVASKLAGADILVLPNLSLRISLSYTSPLKLFEYMASGRPIVASDLPAIREILDEQCAVFVTAGHAQSLAEGIQRLLDDPAFARRLGEDAERRAALYTWDARAARLEAEFQHVIEDRPR